MICYSRYSFGMMMMKTLPNFEITKNTIHKIILKHFFFGFAQRGGGEGGGSEWSAESLFGLKYDMIWLQILSRATKERVDFFRVDRSDGWSFLTPSFLRVSIRFGSTGGIYAIV